MNRFLQLNSSLRPVRLQALQHGPAIVGRLDFEQWSDRSSGEMRSKTLVVIDRLELCGSRNGAQQMEGAADLAAFSAGQSVSDSASQAGTAAAARSRSSSAATWGAPAGVPAPAAPAWSTSGPISDEEVPF
jgi:single-stranded DNA-binding protein